MSMDHPVRHYLNYVRDVLGVTSFLRPQDPEAALQRAQHGWATRTDQWPAPRPVDLLVFHVGTGTLFHGVTAELWGKMKHAMKLDERFLLEVETHDQDWEKSLHELMQSYPAAVALVLSEQPVRSSELRVFASARLVESFSPRTLVESADLKRAAWTDLQLVMKSLDPH